MRRTREKGLSLIDDNYLEMKKILFIMSVLCFLVSCVPKLTEKVEVTFPNGQPQLVKMLDKSNHCVKEIEYYETGQVKMGGAMKDDQREGVWTAYFPDGRPQSIADFKAGKMNGASKVYWENGNLRWEGFYKEDQYFGKWKYYDEQGNLLKEVDYGE